MAAFTDLDWGRFDVHAIVTNGGLATIEERRHAGCRDWLGRHGYEIESLDCRVGLARAIPELGRMLRWGEQFGYNLEPDNRNLDALRDGFRFQVPAECGRAFEVIGAETAWHEDAQWFLGLASIAREHSCEHLALGRRFLTLFVVSEGSPLFGAALDGNRIPWPYWNMNQDAHEFVR